MNETNGELKCQASRQWANYLETGNPDISAHDTIHIYGRKSELRKLSLEDQQLVGYLRKLANLELTLDHTPADYQVLEQ
jgi:hypothetical protein